jgi:type II secretory pathway pseudopilin PulG
MGIATASLLVGVASSVGSFVQQGQQAKSQRRAMEANYAQQMDTLQQQYKQTNQQATDEMSARAREAMIERARLRVAGGESGLSGNSNDRIVQ